VSYDDQEGVEENGNNLQMQKLLLINARSRAWLRKHESSGKSSRALLFFMVKGSVQTPFSFFAIPATGVEPGAVEACIVISWPQSRVAVHATFLPNASLSSKFLMNCST
jgi:hypothetical protein